MASSVTAWPSSRIRAITAVSSAREAGQTRLLGESLRQQARAPLADARARRLVLGAQGRHHQEREVREPARERREHLEAEVVGPVEILEREQRWLRRGVGQDVDQVEDEHAATLRSRGPPVVLRLREALDESFARGREARRPSHRPGEVPEDGLRHVLVLRRQAAARRPEAGAGRLPHDGAQQPGLADPRVAAQEQQVTTTGGDGFAPALGETEQVIATDDDRTDDRSDPGHGASLGARSRPASVERRMLGRRSAAARRPPGQDSVGSIACRRRASIIAWAWALSLSLGSW